LGKFGPLAQVGDPEDEEKPIFASLTPEQQLDTITLEEALSLFELPKALGEYEGEEVLVNNGRYGPYVKFGNTFVSLPSGKNPNDFSMDEAIALIEEKKKADAPIAVYQDQPVTKGVGRFGPFIKWSGMFINVNKKYNFDALTQEDIEQLIEEKIQKEKDKLIQDWPEAGIRIEKARWGRHHIIKGRLKVELSKDIDSTKISLEEATQRLESIKKPKKSRAKKS
jgi:DNA topoisomerase-1